MSRQNKLEKLVETVYSIAQVYAPYEMSRASDFQQLPEFYNWLAEAIDLSIELWDSKQKQMTYDEPNETLNQID